MAASRAGAVFIDRIGDFVFNRVVDVGTSRVDDDAINCRDEFLKEDAVNCRDECPKEAGCNCRDECPKEADCGCSDEFPAGCFDDGTDIELSLCPSFRRLHKHQTVKVRACVWRGKSIH